MSTELNDVYIKNGVTDTPSNPNDSSNKIPDTAWVQALIATLGFTSGSNVNGWWAKHEASGLILQWGVAPVETTLTFPIAFTNAASLSIVANLFFNGSGGSQFVAVDSSPTTTSFYIRCSATGRSATWLAIGF